MRTIVTVLFIALIAWMGGSTWYWVCKVKGHCDEIAVTTGVVGEMPDATTPEVALPKAPAIPPFLISLGGQPFMEFDNNLRFGKSGAEGVMPGTIRAALDSLAAHLKTNPNRDVEITGLFSTAENNGTDFSNLGLARADFIKQQLIARGVDAERLITSYESSSDANFFALPDTLIGGIGLSLVDRQVADAAGVEADTDTDAGAAARSVAAAAPDARNVNFDHNSYNLTMDSDLRAYITRAIQYLNQNSGSQLVLTGYADSQGSSSSNIDLSRNRANALRKYFQDFGLANNRIKVLARGEANPIASNDTEAGRRQNRRVEISISN